MPLRRLVVATSIALTGACSLLIDTDDLDAGATTIAPIDDAGDTGADASRTDAASIPDGGSPADADAGQSSPCTQPHAFCDDFDDGNDDLATRWDSLTTESGPLSFATDLWISAPRSLRASVGPHDGIRRTGLRKALPIPNGKVRVEVDVHAAATAGTYGEVDPVEIILRPGPPGREYHSLYLIIQPNQRLLEYYLPKLEGGADNISQPVTFTNDAWHHLVFTFESSPARAALAIDGVTIALTAFAGPAVTSLELGVGAAYTEGVTNDWKLTLDNVVVDTP
ncbi:MAG: hypothetical protein KF795_16235 [Labilithrix sp.]|nr:hypothetical protein [Labilithrix sp.]MBX3222067.1 hypothetical protein [Labilithrix sp.]